MHKIYNGIQLLRFISALMVLITHATFYVKTRIDLSFYIWPVGSQGVKIFFVISGFVMAISSGALTNSPVNWKDFILRRINRILPLYWILNLLKIGMIMFLPTIIFANPDIKNIILSLLFVPSKNANGIIETFMV